MLSLATLGSAHSSGNWSVGNCQTSSEFMKGFPIFVWDAASGKCEQRFDNPWIRDPDAVAPEDAGARTVFSSDGKYLALALSNQYSTIYHPPVTIQIWETHTWTSVKNLTLEHMWRVDDIKFSPNFKQIAVALTKWRHDAFLDFPADAAVRIFDTSSWDSMNLTMESGLADFDGTGLGYSPDGKQLFIVQEFMDQDDDVKLLGNARIWDTTTGSLHVFPTEYIQSQCAYLLDAYAYSPDGRYLATASDLSNGPGDCDANLIQIWDTSTRKSIKSIGMHFDVGKLTYSPDGRHLIVANSKDLRVYDVLTWEHVFLLDGVLFEKSKWDLIDVAYTLNGKGLALALVRDEDQMGTVNAVVTRIFDTATWTILRSWETPFLAPKDARDCSAYWFSFTFSPDGTHLATPIDYYCDDSAHHTLLV